MFSRWQINGKDNVPKEGPLLVVANHMTNLDPPLLSVSLGRYTAFMAKRELFRRKIIGYLISGLGGFPVRGQLMRQETLRIAEKILSDGRALVIFPEGMRSRTNQLRRAFNGAAFIALRTGVPVLPVAITGTEKVNGIAWLRRPRLTVTFGRPFHLTISDSVTDRDKATDYIMERIAELLPPQYHGVYNGNMMEEAHDSNN